MRKLPSEVSALLEKTSQALAKADRPQMAAGFLIEDDYGGMVMRCLSIRNYCSTIHREAIIDRFISMLDSSGRTHIRHIICLLSPEVTGSGDCRIVTPPFYLRRRIFMIDPQNSDALVWLADNSGSAPDYYSETVGSLAVAGYW